MGGVDSEINCPFIILFVTMTIREQIGQNDMQFNIWASSRWNEFCIRQSSLYRSGRNSVRHSILDILRHQGWESASFCWSICRSSWEKVVSSGFPEITETAITEILCSWYFSQHTYYALPHLSSDVLHIFSTYYWNKFLNIILFNWLMGLQFVYFSVAQCFHLVLVIFSVLPQKKGVRVSDELYICMYTHIL